MMSWRSFLRGLDNIVSGSFATLLGANRFLGAQLKIAKRDSLATDERNSCSIDTLEQSLADSVDRLQRIENKAMGTLLGVAVALSVMGASSSAVSPDGVFSTSPVLRLLGAILGTLSLVYLFGSGFLALAAYKVGAVYAPTLAQRAQENEVARKITLLHCIDQNNRVVTMRANRLSVAFDLLRNGLLLVVIIALLLLLWTTMLPSL